MRSAAMRGGARGRSSQVRLGPSNFPASFPFGSPPRPRAWHKNINPGYVSQVKMASTSYDHQIRRSLGMSQRRCSTDVDFPGLLCLYWVRTLYLSLSSISWFKPAARSMHLFSSAILTCLTFLVRIDALLRSSLDGRLALDDRLDLLQDRRPVLELRKRQVLLYAVRDEVCNALVETSL